MNDLLPPDRRSIPKRRRALMRERLDEEISTTTTTVGRRREGAVRRFGIPAAVAAVAALLAIGGYVVATDDDGVRNDPRGDTGMAGQDDDRSESDGQPKPEAGVSEPMADPSEPYAQCVRMVVRQFGWRGEPVDQEPVGKLAIDNGKGIVVVVANSTDSYTCNLEPDHAVSRGNVSDGEFQASDFWFALNATGNVLRGDEGDMVWAGGEAPEGVTAIRYTFPDGHTEAAVVQDGFWAVQYYSERVIPHGPNDHVEVTVEGTTPQTFELPFTSDTECNQISHGC